MQYCAVLWVYKCLQMRFSFYRSCAAGCRPCRTLALRHHVFTNFLWCIHLQKIIKYSVDICRSYRRRQSRNFFGTQCTLSSSGRFIIRTSLVYVRLCDTQWRFVTQTSSVSVFTLRCTMHRYNGLPASRIFQQTCYTQYRSAVTAVHLSTCLYH